MKKGFIVAIDGPVASGKGTVAQKLAEQLHGVNFNTGGMYRALALKAQREDISLSDTAQLISVLSKRVIDVAFDVNNPSIVTIRLDGENVTDKLLTPELSMGASTLAQNGEVVKCIFDLQRAMALGIREKGFPVIMEGRQIGTDVLPDADMKVFLTADSITRAKRRLEQYYDKDIEQSLDDVIEQTKIRDEQDMNRTVGPLVRDPENHGYFILDNTHMSENATLSVIIEQLKEKKLI